MTEPVSDRVKKRLQIQTLLGLGWSSRAIAEEVGCTEQTVKNWKKRFQDGESEQDRPRSGRPKVLTPRLENVVLTRSKGKHKRSIRKTTTWLQSQGTKVSRETVHRTFKRHGLHPYHRRKQQKLLPRHKQQRVSFARKYKDHNWETTLMTDETEFELNPTWNPKNDVIWAHSPEEVPPIDRESYSPSGWSFSIGKNQTSLL